MKIHTHVKSGGFAHIAVVAIILVAAAIIGAGFYVLKTSANSKDLKNTKDLAFITSSPVELAQINNFSKFRSCSGHDYSGTNVAGVKEAMRSMKHYAGPDSAFADTTDKLKVFAPFDGSISFVGKSKGRGVGLGLRPAAASGWVFEFGHVQPLDNIKKGVAVKSGELVGYADVSQGAGGFDLQLYHPKFIHMGFNGLDSFMNHMTSDLAKSYKNYGFSKDNLIVSKADRDANPCKTDGKKDNGDAVFTSDRTKDIVVTTKPLSATQTVAPRSGAKAPGDTPDTSNTASDECAASVPVAQRPPGCSQSN